MTIVYEKNLNEEEIRTTVCGHDFGNISVCTVGSGVATSIYANAPYIRALAAALIEAADAVEVKEPVVDFAQVEYE